MYLWLRVLYCLELKIVYMCALLMMKKQVFNKTYADSRVFNYESLNVPVTHRNHLRLMLIAEFFEFISS